MDVHHIYLAILILFFCSAMRIYLTLQKWLASSPQVLDPFETNGLSLKAYF